ncbi:MAG: hypothetical protein AAF655_12035 [Bacteroidota bacterium]
MKFYISLLLLLTIGGTVQAQSLSASDVLIGWQDGILAYAKKTARSNLANINNPAKLVNIGLSDTGELERFLQMSKDQFTRSRNLNDLDVRDHIQTVYPDLHASYKRYCQERITQRNRASRETMRGPMSGRSNMQAAIPPN